MLLGKIWRSRQPSINVRIKTTEKGDKEKLQYDNYDTGNEEKIDQSLQWIQKI